MTTKPEHHEEIKETIRKMELSATAENALIRYTFEIYDKLEQGKSFVREKISNRVATSIFLACDKKACITIPKLKRVCSSGISVKRITQARKALGIPRATTYDKLDTLCDTFGVTNQKIRTKAYDYVKILDRSGGCAPTGIAAAALYMAGFGDDAKDSDNLPLTESAITRLTGVNAVTMQHHCWYLMHALGYCKDEPWFTPGDSLRVCMINALEE